MRCLRPALRMALYGLAALAAIGALALVLLRWDAGRSRDDWFAERQGRLAAADLRSEEPPPGGRPRMTAVRLHSDSGLSIFFRVLHSSDAATPAPVLILLGGHRTGSDAVQLFDRVGEETILALDYPYDGSLDVDGPRSFIRVARNVRGAFLDLPPAISLIVDWLEQQPWADPNDIAMGGVSLGVPFAAAAAARDRRLRGLLLVHGAADNRLWLELNIARRFGPARLQPALATLLHWLVYGPLFDTRRHVAAVAPRPVLVVGARNDEQTPEAQTELLYESARQPKRLRWTEGGHVGPTRSDIIEEIIRIADEELPFSHWPATAEAGPQK